MAKTYIAQSVDKNHDWDFTVDGGGGITNLVIKAMVNYGEMGQMESKDIWSILNTEQKTRIQSAYNQVRQWFDNQFLG